MSSFSTNTKHSILFILTLAFSPITLIFTSLLLIYRQIVDTLLSIKYGEKYGGLLGRDSLFAIEDNSRCIITGLLMIDFENKDPQYVYDSIREKFYCKFFKNPEDFPKLRYLRQSAHNYGFYMKDGYTVDDCVQRSEFQVNVDQKKSLDEDDIQKFVSAYCNKPLPKNDTALWEALVGTRPVRWRGKENTYPLLVRFHHCVGDGITIFNSLFNNFADDVKEDVKISSKLQTAASKFSNLSILTKVYNVINAVFHAPGLMVMAGMEPEVKTSLLVSHELSGDKIAVWAVTNNEDKWVSYIKQMKMKIKDTFFLDIMLSGVAASLTDYFKAKNYEDEPAVLKTCLGFKYKLDVLPRDRDNVKTKNIENTFTIVLCNIPTGNISSTEPILSRMEKVHTELCLVRKSPQAQINFWSLNYICPILPIPLLESISASISKCPVGVSNMPGPSNNTFNGHSIEHIIYWAPHRGVSGFTLSILTSGEKLQLGLLVDKSLISSRTECQRIVDDVLKNIRKLGNEIHQL